jgi:hypothetical protein
MIERMRSMKARLAIAGLAVAAIVTLGVVPMVTAASPAPATSPTAPAASPAAPVSPAASPAAPVSPTASPAAGAAKARPIRNAILAGTVRADLTVVKRDGSTVLLHYERGQVTALTPTSITIQGRDGKGATFTVTAETRVRSNGKRIAFSDLKVGDRAMVLGTSKDGAYTAVLIRCVQPAAQQP